MHFEPGQLNQRDFYQVLIGAVAPRPIAWVSTLDADGCFNLAPFSFFNVISAQPPLLGFSPALRRSEEGSAPKDTLRNIRATGEFVVAVVTEELAEAMNATSAEFPPHINEFERAGLTAKPAALVRPPLVAESPVNFECRLYKILDFGDAPPSGSLVIGEIVSVCLTEAALSGGKFDGGKLSLIGRMGRLQYTRTRDRFDLHRPEIDLRAG